MDKSRKIKSAIVYFILTIGSVIMLVPFLWMFLTAFKSTSEATQMNPFIIFPTVWRKEAFLSIISKMNFLRLYWNTLMLIVERVICAVLTATMAGYAFGRLHFKGKNLAFSLVLFQMMVPSQIFIIPQYLMVSKLGMLNTSFGLEAARLDGCNIGQTFLYVMAPLTKSSMVALGIFTALFGFKELMWPLVVNTEQNTMPLSAALAKLQGQFETNYPELMAASLLACIPMIIIYLIFQKQFIEGIATSGGKL